MGFNYVDSISMTSLARHLMVSLPTLKKYAKNAGIKYDRKTGLTSQQVRILMVMVYEKLGRKP